MGPRTGLDRFRKISPPPVFDPRTVQPVASRYNDYATRPINTVITSQIFTVVFLQSSSTFGLLQLAVYFIYNEVLEKRIASVVL